MVKREMVISLFGGFYNDEWEIKNAALEQAKQEIDYREEGSEWDVRIVRGKVGEDEIKVLVTLTYTPSLNLASFAHQIGIICSMVPDQKPLSISPCDGLTVTVQVVMYNGHPLYKINGKSAGNLWGAIQEFSRLVNEAEPKLEKI